MKIATISVADMPNEQFTSSMGSPEHFYATGMQSQQDGPPMLIDDEQVSLNLAIEMTKKEHDFYINSRTES